MHSTFVYNVEFYALCLTLSNYIHVGFSYQPHIHIQIYYTHERTYITHLYKLPVALFYARKMSPECSEKFDVRELHYHHRLFGLII